jgi:GGDEF domain-containing protein
LELYYHKKKEKIKQLIEENLNICYDKDTLDSRRITAVIKFFQGYKERKRSPDRQVEQVNRQTPGGVMAQNVFAKKVDSALSAGAPGCLVLFEIDKPVQLEASDDKGMEAAVTDNVTTVLTGHFRKSDYFSQLKENEYAVWLNGIAEEDVSCIGRRVSAINDKLLHPQEGTAPATVSAGAAFGLRAADFKDLHKKAGRALYQVKIGGGCGFQVYTEK